MRAFHWADGSHTSLSCILVENHEKFQRAEDG
jgi:hypothetical protein